MSFYFSEPLDPGFRPRDSDADQNDTDVVDWDNLSNEATSEESTVHCHRNPFILSEAEEEGGDDEQIFPRDSTLPSPRPNVTKITTDNCLQLVNYYSSSDDNEASSYN